MSLQPLDKKLRKQLENTIVTARSIAESAARSALGRLSVGASKPGEHLTEVMRQQRNKLRAHGRQLGDSRQNNAEQSIEHLVQETAYEQWHRMLFARFLAENHLLIYEDGVTPLSIQDCFELAADEDGVNGWELAGRFASAMLPQLFRPENPVLSLHFSPEHQRTLEKLLEGLDAETFQASDSLGWVYQYWQTQKKDEVNKSGNKIGADELSAVTQLFTEPYMVSFLLDNSLGAWWVSNYPEHKDLLPFQYLRYAPEQSDQNDAEYKETTIPAAGTFEQWPKNLSELKMLDPCCGSGHFLVATLLMLVPMRIKAEGLSADEAIARVLAENIHGLELDQRCVEIAAFAVALEAWRYPDSSGYRPLPSLNIAWVGQSIKATKAEWLALAGTDDNLSLGMEALYNTFKDAPLLGSLIDPSKSIAKDLLNDGFADLQPLLNQALQQFEVSENQEAAIAAKGMALAASLLSKKYTIIATNVPYKKTNELVETLANHFEVNYPLAKSALETVFLLRCINLINEGNNISVVIPQSWMVQPSYSSFRKNLLKTTEIKILARLGPGAFDEITGEVVNVVLLSLDKKDSSKNTIFRAIDCGRQRGGEVKSSKIKNNNLINISQDQQLDNPASVIILSSDGQDLNFIENYVSSVQGIKTGDDNRYKRTIWEFEEKSSDWIYYQSTVDNIKNYAGLEHLLYWKENGEHLARKQGMSAWGRDGVAFSQMSNLPCSIYMKCAFDSNMTAIVIRKDKCFLPVLSYSFSGEYSNDVRDFDQSIKPTNSSFEKVLFDFNYWTKVAQEKYPNGLPKPYSDDPTQWIFHGHPAQSESPLQVAVARLLGYQWPTESDKDMELSDEARAWIAKCKSLSSFVDDDGIVCLSPMRGEKAADERLEALLMAAFGEQWNGVLRNQLLTEVQCSGKTLAYWLRDKFFEQHCKLFQDRPFIWHIWDGLADGFNALVNYQQLDRKKLERLIYTYLGDWIRTQDHGVKEGVDGALLRLQAAQILKTRLEAILEGEVPYDIFVRWKSLAEQPIGWNPDINDGVRLNIRPFMTVPDVGKKGAGILRSKPNIKWTKDRGNDVASAPWYKLGLQYGESEGSRINDHHLTLAEKKAAREA